jgi:tetratricopeptide (TPR) repeat protein
MRLALLIALLLFTAAADAQLKERKDDVPASSDSTAGLVDEDEDLLPTTNYAFNPIQAKNDLKVGKFYAKRGSYRAAAGRFLEATKWNPLYAEAHLRLGEAREAMNQGAQALDAYLSYLSLEPNGKVAAQVRERVAVLERAQESLPLAAEDAEEASAAVAADTQP